MDAFTAHLQRATEVVSNWPEWKQRILGAVRRISSSVEPDEYDNADEISRLLTALQDDDAVCDDYYVEEEEETPKPTFRRVPPKVKDEHDMADVLFQYLLDQYPDYKITRLRNASGQIKHTWVMDVGKRSLDIRLNDDQLEFRTTSKGEWISVDLNSPEAFGYVEFLVHVASNLH